MSATLHRSATEFLVNREPKGNLRLALTVVLGCLLSSNLCAQSAESQIAEENWYQVELLIFKRVSTSEDTQRQELWPRNITLSYPPRVQFLTDPNKPVDTKIPEVPDDDVNRDTLAIQALENTSGQNSTPMINTTNSEIDFNITDIEQPYVYLSEAHGIIENVSQLTRRRDNKILFHQSWAQPMLAFDEAPAIIIRGGEFFGEHAELEGSITLSISRYLHIHTNLWLTDFEPNYGQQPYDWPALPTLPATQLPRSLMEQSTADAQHYSENTQVMTSTQEAASLELTANQRLIGFNNLTSTNDDSTNPQFDSVFERDNNYFSNYTNITQQPFLAKRVVTLMQKRRMRSNELHYIDHPLMGIIIKMRPYTPAHLKPEEEKSVTAE